MPAAAHRPAFVDHCVELLAPLGAVRPRRMFGGWGLYIDDVFVALIVGERLFLKAAPADRDAYAAAASEPFVYERAGQATSLGYWSAPAEALDSPALMAPWARRALQAALAARAAPALRRAAAKTPARPAATPKTATKRASRRG